jgi:hypothetical protein
MMNQMSSNVGPMTRMGSGMPAAGDMNTGMGMLQGGRGAPTSSDYGPSMGRGMGVGSTGDQRVGNEPLASEHSGHRMSGMHQTDAASISTNANQVPGFPQDAYMEGPMMNMDNMIHSPETYGLPAGWTTGMQGMMTLVRVLQPDKYEDILNRVKQARGTDMSGMAM